MTTSAIHPNLKHLRNSSTIQLHKCPRKFELDRLLPDSIDWNSQEDIDLSFGSIVGAGVAEYLVSRNLNKAYFAAFLTCTTDLDFHTTESAISAGKSFWHALFAISRFVLLDEQEYRDYEVVHFQGKPAVELSFLVDCGDGFTNQGHVDVLLQHKRTGNYRVLDCKTTKYRSNIAQWQNAPQALGYSIMVDAITKTLATTYEVDYCLYNSKTQEWESFNFIKTHAQRAEWIRSLLRDIQHIAEYAEDDHFPKHGESCYDFFRPCSYLDTCQFANHSIFGGKEPPVKLVEKEHFDFHFFLEDLIQAQIDRE